MLGKKTAICLLSSAFLAFSLFFSGFAVPHSWAQGDIDDELDSVIEDDLDDDIDDAIEDQIEDAVEDQIEDAVEDEIEDAVEGQIEDAVEDDIEDAVEDQIEDAVEDDIEDAVEARIEDAVEDDIEDSVEDDIEDAVEDDIEEAVEDDIDDGLEDDIEDGLDDDIEDGLDDDIDDGLDDDIDDGRDDDIDDGIEDDLDNEISDDTTTDSDESGAQFDRQKELATTQLDSAFELEIDDSNNIRVKNELLILTDDQSLQSLQANGFVVQRVTYLPALDKLLAEVIKPDDLELDEAKQTSVKILGADADVDFNHFFQIQQSSAPATAPTAPAAPNSSQWGPPGAILPLPDLQSSGIKVGIIDSWVNVEHEALKKTAIKVRSFTRQKHELTDDHGTAVASILCGNSNVYRGLLPGADCYAANAFYHDARVGRGATTRHLLLALNWLAEMEVDVINMSLAGPDNDILQQILDKLRTMNIALVAAAGNAGPASKPLYPAAYNSVVAVTAINQKNQAYYMANRGMHIDLSAPGVNILHARADGSYGRSSGTSFAAPFVSAAIAAAMAGNDKSQNVPVGQLKRKMYRHAEDLGQSGHDIIYGHGLVRPLD